MTLVTDATGRMGVAFVANHVGPTRAGSRSGDTVPEASGTVHFDLGDPATFASSLAVFGAPFPERITDDFHFTPLTSYGTQQAMHELPPGDYSHRGFLNGVSLRFPSICIRPGKPNRAASSFFSHILPQAAARDGGRAAGVRRRPPLLCQPTIRCAPDMVVAVIIAGWPCNFATARDDDAQFRAEMSFRRIIDVYMEEKLDGRGADIPAS